MGAETRLERFGRWLTGHWLAGLRLGLAAGVLSFAALALAASIAMSAMGPPPLDAAGDGSITVVDRKGRLLRAFTTAEGRWRLPTDETTVDPRYLAMLLAYEDRRFYDHTGVDPVAVVRALGLAAMRGHFVSGASTLTMQVARLLEGRHERTAGGKLRQMVRALQIEQRLGKAEILRLYLKLAPFGGNLEGVRAASLAYLGKEPVRLSIGEAALLVALPQAPGVRRPDIFPENARLARDRVLDRMVEEAVITADEATYAKTERIPDHRKPFPQLAPHVADAEFAVSAPGAICQVTLDRDIQASLEQLAAEGAQSLGSRLSAAILAIDHRTGEVIAHVGSPGFLDKSRFGSIDMVRAVRSPGSTLKPLIYGLAFEAGLAHPETLIEDRPTRFGAYAPKNFDDQFHGTVSVREALQQSLNVPAVKVLSAVSPMRLMSRLKQAGSRFELPDQSVPSLAVALGGVGLSLSDLVRLYAAIARGGTPIDLTYHLSDSGHPGAEASGYRLLSPVAAWYLSDILRGTPPPVNAKGGQIAYKTGTSYGYRDAWAAGFDGRVTIAVWVGRPDGVPTPGLTGFSSAAPLLFDAFARVSLKRVPLPAAPSGALLSSGPGLPPPLRIFAADRSDEQTGPYTGAPVAIAFPPDDAELELQQTASGEARPILLKAEGGVLPLTWMVDGAPIPSDGHRRETLFQPRGHGFVKVSVIDAAGHVDRVSVKLP